MTAGDPSQLREHGAESPRIHVPTTSTRLIAHKEGALGFVLFNHPERRNAMSLDMWQALPGAIASLDADPNVRVLVLAGAGEQAFISGADISEFGSERASFEAEQRYAALTKPAFEALEALEKPSIAMIRGYCIGGGLAIALMCDLRIAAQDSRFGIPAARLGLGYGFEGVRTLTAIVGPARAKEILFTGRQLDASEALHMGLVNRVVPRAELESSAGATATQIADNAPLTVRASKLAVKQVLKEPEHRDLGLVNRALAVCFNSADYLEGRNAFREKRKPRFEGR